MVDSVAVLSPTDRVTYQGSPVSGAKIKFFNAGTTTPKTVYSDSGLSNSLGSIVYTDSDGFPVTASGGSTKTAIFTGTAAYKVIITDSADVTLITVDNLKGALDTSIFATGTLSNAMPVISKTANYTIVSGDGYKVLNANPSGGAFTLTLPASVTVGDGWWIALRLDAASTSNAVTIARAGTNTIKAKGGTALTSLTLAGGGAGGFIVSDGGGSWSWLPLEVEGGNNFTATSIASASTVDLGASASSHVTVTGTTTITSFGSAPERFRIVRFTGALTLTHNATSLILPGGANITTTADDVYTFISDASGNWRMIAAPPSTAATQAQQEAATATSAYVTPAVQKFHPLHAKVMALITVSGGVPTLNAASVGVASITDNGVGDLILTFTTAFSSASYVAVPSTEGTTTDKHAPFIIARTTTTLRVINKQSDTGAATDPQAWHVVVFGDQ